MSTLADEQKKPESPKPADKGHEGHKHGPGEHKTAPAPKKAAPAAASSPAGAKPVKGAPAASVKKAPAKPDAKAKPAAKKGEGVKIVDKPSKPKYVANAKPTLTPEQKQGLSQRAVISGRRPWFRRTQWYEYKRLADSGWRKARGVDSAMRRHFGYEQPMVNIGFGGPKAARGLHPSGFREVYVEQIADLKKIDTKIQAARVSGNLGRRTLKALYAEADKLGVRILNRRNLE